MHKCDKQSLAISHTIASINNKIFPVINMYTFLGTIFECLLQFFFLAVDNEMYYYEKCKS